MTSPYDELLHLPRPASKQPKMPRHDRAAQFSAFAALSGHDDAVAETARITDRRVELDETVIAALNRKLQHLAAPSEMPQSAVFTFFRPDGKKKGGAYITKTGAVEKIDLLTRIVVLSGGESIPIDEIIAIDFLP